MNKEEKLQFLIKSMRGFFNDFLSVKDEKHIFSLNNEKYDLLLNSLTKIALIITQIGHYRELGEDKFLEDFITAFKKESKSMKESDGLKSTIFPLH